MRPVRRWCLALIAGFAASVAAHAEVSIAVVGPMTGQYAAFGAQYRAGAEMAVADINAGGGLLGQQVKLEIGDDACDPKQAVAVANQLSRREVKFVAGHFCSGSSIPASHVYAEERIIMISPASTNPKFTDERPGPGVMRVCGRDDQQGSFAGKFLATRYKDKNIAVVHDKTAYGKGLADDTRKFMRAAGKREKMYEAVSAGEKDYSALVSKLKASSIDVLYYGGYHTEAGLIVRQMRDQGMKTQLMSGDALVTKEFWQITGAAGDGTLMTFSPDPTRLPANAAIVKRFKDKGIEPEGYVLYTYAAFQVYAQAVQAAGSTDTRKVIDAINKGTFKTVLGDLSFDKKGDPELEGYVVYVWKDGNYDYLKM
ncbi:MAG: branched-chain amino acid ABC transporter substrate-binding protein [Burkholderiales bacterium]